jgi:hypothetical protein
MLRFETFEELGVAAAVMSDMSDGDCGFTGSDPATAARNRERVCGPCSVDPHHLVCAQQVHGSVVVWASESDRGRHYGGSLELFPGTDAILTGARGLPVAIFVADCVPVLLYDKRNHVGGLVHAGREGTFLRVTEKAVAGMRERYGSNPDDVYALIGPSAGPCCYEVNTEMARFFADAGVPVSGRNLDLWKANFMQLRANGIPESNITIAGTCTVCTTAFFSHRRQPNGARNVVLFVL